MIAKSRGFNNIAKEREKTKGAELSKEIVSQFHFPIACSVLSVFRHFFVPPPTSPQWWNSPLPVAPRSYRLGCWLSHTLALPALPMYLVKVDHCPALPYKKTWKDNGRDSVIKKHPRWRSQWSLETNVMTNQPRTLSSNPIPPHPQKGYFEEATQVSLAPSLHNLIYWRPVCDGGVADGSRRKWNNRCNQHYKASAQFLACAQTKLNSG